MKEIFIQAIVPIITAIVSYLMATYKSKIDLKKQVEINKTEIEKIKEQNKIEIEKIREKNKADIEKINAEIKQRKEDYDNQKLTDISYDFLMSAIKNPQEATEKISDLIKFSSSLDKIK